MVDLAATGLEPRDPAPESIAPRRWPASSSRTRRSSSLTRFSADRGAASSWAGSSSRWSTARSPPSRRSASASSRGQSWNPPLEEVRRGSADLRHARHIGDRHAHRRAGRHRHRDLPHRALPHGHAPAHRHRHRAARRHPVDHLRHVGLFFLPVPAARAAFLQSVLGRCRPRLAVRGPALRHRHAHGRLILAIMVLPFITSITRDVFETVPPMLKEIGLRPGLHDAGKS